MCDAGHRLWISDERVCSALVDNTHLLDLYRPGNRYKAMVDNRLCFGTWIAGIPLVHNKGEDGRLPSRVSKQSARLSVYPRGKVLVVTKQANTGMRTESSYLWLVSVPTRKLVSINNSNRMGVS
jgi:hypothetical protein